MPNELVQIVLDPKSVTLSKDQLSLRVDISSRSNAVPLNIQAQPLVSEFIVPIPSHVLDKLNCNVVQVASANREPRQPNCTLINEVNTANIPGYKAHLATYRLPTMASSTRLSSPNTGVPVLVIRGPLQKFSVFSNGYFYIRTMLLCPGAPTIDLRHQLGDKQWPFPLVSGNVNCKR